MIHYDYYADVPDGAVDALVRSAKLARLVTVGETVPHLGLFPFTHGDGFFELHLHRKDEQLADLRARSSCLLEIDEVLSSIPSDWIHPENASFATAYHKTVAFECAATLDDDVDALARQQERLLARYQPGIAHRPLAADDAMYASMLKVLVAVRLEVRATKVKFKLGQNRDLETRAKVAGLLRERGGDRDAQTADALQWTIDLGWTTAGRR